MPAIKVTDIAWGRLRSPDLDQAEAFLSIFGMVRAARTSQALYMRGTDRHHHLHVTELGPSGFVGLAFHAASADDLAIVARLDGASPVESIDEPGGGRRVRLTDPNGYRVEIVHGLAAVEPLPVTRSFAGEGKERRPGELCRPRRGPSQVRRIGHAVITAPDLAATVRWYRETLGLVCSDDVYDGDTSNVVGSFNRCDRGDDYSDHHTVYCIKAAKRGLQHLAFEVQDLDDLMVGHEHLKRHGYRHSRGIGRHHLGSQLFDYWWDPWGRLHEHWTDTDVLNAHAAPGLVQAGSGTEAPWGDVGSREFRDSITS